MQKLFKKSCEFCSLAFETKSLQKRFCSFSCAAKFGARKRELLRIKKPLTPCEKCSLTPKKKYSSGRFCSEKCARSFSTSLNRKKISEKTSETFKNKYHKPDVLPCERCGIIPELKHGSGRFCLKCASSCPPNSNVDRRMEWERSDKLNICKKCSNTFLVTWKTRSRSYCSESCRNNSFSEKMLQRNVEGRFFQSFGRRIKYTNYGQNIHCDSLIEWCALEDIFEKYNSQIISATRSTYKIPYIDELGKERTYNPDFNIELYNGIKFCIECKSDQSGTNETWNRYHKDAEIKFHLLKDFCEKNGIEFIWFTQKSRKDLYNNLRLTHGTQK